MAYKLPISNGGSLLRREVGWVRTRLGGVWRSGVGTKLRLKASTSVSVGNSWRKEIYLMALFLKLVCRS